MFVVLNRPAHEPPPRITGWALASFLLVGTFMPLATCLALAEQTQHGARHCDDRVITIILTSFLLTVPPIVWFREKSEYLVNLLALVRLFCPHDGLPHLSWNRRSSPARTSKALAIQQR